MKNKIIKWVCEVMMGERQTSESNTEMDKIEKLIYSIITTTDDQIALQQCKKRWRASLDRRIKGEQTFYKGVYGETITEALLNLKSEVLK